MKSGIYSLHFGNGFIYIGKSKNIEARYEQHKEALRKGRAAKPLQNIYDTLRKVPFMEVCIECHPDHLEVMEAYFINKNLGSKLLNTIIPKSPFNLDIGPEAYYSYTCPEQTVIDNCKIPFVEMCLKLHEQHVNFIKTDTELGRIKAVNAILAKDRDAEEIIHDIEGRIVKLQEELAATIEELDYASEDILDKDKLIAKLKEELRTPWYKKLLKYLT
jgi:hypothetical protein